MRSLILVLAFVATSALAVAGPGAGEPVQSQASFEAAIRNRSTSPSYVLITVIDDRTGTARTTCTFANFLRGALHREYGLGSEPGDLAKVDEIALANQAHVFHFTKQDALDNIPLRYSEEELAAARAAFAPLSTPELETIFSSRDSDRRSAFERFSRNAIACVLLERGLSPIQADRSGEIYANH